MAVDGGWCFVFEHTIQKLKTSRSEYILKRGRGRGKYQKLVLYKFFFFFLPLDLSRYKTVQGRGRGGGLCPTPILVSFETDLPEP